jgi:hypothetical protein
MGKELKFGPMEQSMRENGLKIKQMERVNSGMLMVISTTASGKMIKLMGMASTCM